MQSSDAGIAVVDALRRNEVLAGVYGEKYLFVDLGTHTLRYLLGDDGIYGFICLSLKMKTPRKDRLTGCCGILLMVSSLFGDFIQPETFETVPGCRAVLEPDIDASVLVESDLLGIGGREVVPVSDGNIVVIETDDHL